MAIRSVTWKILFFAALAGAGLPCVAQVPAPTAGPVLVNEYGGVQEYRLSNGLTVLFRPDVQAPSVVLNVVYRVGSRDEGPGTTGHAHLLEHMVLKKCGEIADIKAEMKARGIAFNAFTRWDSTNYVSQVTGDHAALEWLVNAQARCMCNANFTETDLASEMTVVQNEFDMRRANSIVTLMNALRGSAFRFHPYGRSVAGQLKDIEAVEFEQLRNFYQRHYRPDNATLIVVGSFDAPKLLSRIVESFGAVHAPGGAVTRAGLHEPFQFSERETTEYRVGGGGAVAVGYRTPEGRHPDRVPLTVLAHMVARPQKGALAEAMRTANFEASASIGVDDLVDGGLFQVVAAGQPTLQLRDFLINFFEVNLLDRLTQEDLETAKRELAQGISQGWKQPAIVSEWLLGAVVQGDWRLVFANQDALQEATLANVKRVAMTYLVKFNRNVAMLGAHGADMTVDWVPAPPLAKQVAALKPRESVGSSATSTLTPAALEQRTRRWSPRPGWQFAHFDAPDSDGKARVSLMLDFGQSSDMRNQVGLTLIGRLLAGGPSDMAPDEMTKEFRRLDASVDFSTTGQRVQVNVVAPPKSVSAALRLAMRAIRNPRWDPVRLEKERAGREAGVGTIGNDAKSGLSFMLARARNHARQLKPGDPMYEYVGREAKRRLQGVTLDGLKNYYEKVWGAARVRVAAIGEVAPAELESLIVAGLGDWRPGAVYEPVAESGRVTLGGHHHLRTVGQPNGELWAVQNVGLSQRDPDWWALALGLSIFADPQSSRLWALWREKLGISYVVQPFMNSHWHSGVATIGVQATYNPANRVQLLNGWSEELRQVLHQGFSQGELDRVKKNWLANRNAGLENLSLQWSLLTQQTERGTTFLDIEKEFRAIEQVTLQQVNDVFRKHVTADGWLILTAADTGTDLGFGAER